jgi:hypothetical protein
MKYRIQPLNEGHEMPCGITVSCAKTVALVKAINIASALTTLLPIHLRGLPRVPTR